MKLIVEMEMPTRCGACKCRHVEFGMDYVAVFCAIKDNEYVEDPDGRPSWCPIKGVLPEEHGDLIDRDKLKRAFCNHCDGRDTMNGEPNCTEPCFDLGLMDCMPVIIAAERKDDEQIH